MAFCINQAAIGGEEAICHLQQQEMLPDIACIAYMRSVIVRAHQDRGCSFWYIFLAILKAWAGVAMAIFRDSSKFALEAAAAVAAVRSSFLSTSFVSQRAPPIPTNRAPAMEEMETEISSVPIPVTVPNRAVLAKAP